MKIEQNRWGPPGLEKETQKKNKKKHYKFFNNHSLNLSRFKK